VRTTLGRSKDADVVLSPPDVSALHAAITVEAGEVSVEDLRSTNGTFVGQKRLKPALRYPLRPGDCVSVGGVTPNTPVSFILIVEEEEGSSRRANEVCQRAAQKLSKQGKLCPEQLREALRCAKEFRSHLGQLLLLTTDLKLSDWAAAMRVERERFAWSWRRIATAVPRAFGAAAGGLRTLLRAIAAP
jgi:hypothetical protein